jgi:hypothetical protein
MRIIDLKNDGLIFRKELEKFLSSLLDKNISAIEIGYEASQSGWIFIHADSRTSHDRDGKWTNEIADDKLIKMTHWDQSSDDAEEITITDYKGNTTTFLADESDNDLEIAVGKMILNEMRKAKTDGLFAELSNKKIQFDIEDFNGCWAWPEYEELGIKNLI